LISYSSATVCPGFGPTTAVTDSTHLSSFSPITARSATAGWAISTASPVV